MCVPDFFEFEWKQKKRVYKKKREFWGEKKVQKFLKRKKRSSKTKKEVQEKVQKFFIIFRKKIMFDLVLVFLTPM